MADRPSVVVVDDDDGLCRLIQFAVTLNDDIDCSWYSDPRLAARELIGGPLPDLLILDVMMPELSGPQLLEMLRERGGPVKAVYLTAKTLDHEVARLKTTGVLDVWSKPFTPDVLIENVRRFLEMPAAPAT